MQQLKRGWAHHAYVLTSVSAVIVIDVVACAATTKGPWNEREGLWLLLLKLLLQLWLGHRKRLLQRRG